MSDRRPGLIKRLILWNLLVLFLCVILISMGWAEGQAVMETQFRLFAGWFFFLGRNLPVLEMDPDVWVPGALAFFLAAAVIHLVARRRGWPRPLGTGIVLAMLLPLLFAISFLVPGALLQARQLGKEPWIEEGYASPHHRARFMVNGFDDRVRSFAEKQGGVFPEGLGDLPDGSGLPLGELFFPVHDARPPEVPIYLGTGFTSSSDLSLPLLISPAFPAIGGDWRIVRTIGGQQIEIRDEDTDTWIRRALATRSAPVR